MTVNNWRNDFIVRYGNKEQTTRSDYDDLRTCRKLFEKLKSDSACTWCELLYEPLNEPDTTYILESFEKQTINVFGKEYTLNI